MHVDFFAIKIYNGMVQDLEKKENSNLNKSDSRTIQKKITTITKRALSLFGGEVYVWRCYSFVWNVCASLSYWIVNS